MDRKDVILYIEAESFGIREIQRQPYTFIEIGCYFEDKKYTGCGFSKVCYPDVWDAMRGVEIARKRAIGEIYQQIKDR